MPDPGDNMGPRPEAPAREPSGADPSPRASGSWQADFSAAPIDDKGPTSGVPKRSTTEELGRQFQPTFRLSTQRIERIKSAARSLGRQALDLARKIPPAIGRLPFKVKVGVGVAALLAVIAAVIISALEAPTPLFVTSTTKLRSGPSETAFPEVARLERGEAVLAFERASEEHWLMVRDSEGQVGYVLDYGLAKAPAPVRADEPFSRCHRRPMETTTSACLARAQEQLVACKAYCAGSPRAPGCPDGCTDRNTACVGLCDEPVEPTAVVNVPPVAAPSINSLDVQPTTSQTTSGASITSPRKKPADTPKHKHRKGHK